MRSLSTKEVFDIFREICLYFIPFIVGFITLLLQTKNFEDEYDRKIKEVSIVYDSRFEEKLAEYVDFKSKKREITDLEVEKDLEKFEEERYAYIESLLNYANKYRKWTTMTITTKSQIRYQSFAFLLSGILLISSIYIPGRMNLFPQVIGIGLLIIASFHMIYHYLVFRPRLDKKYNQLELRSTKDW